VSLFDQSPEIWQEAALSCNPEDIVDIADQLTILGERNKEAAKDIRVLLGNVVIGRLHDGSLAPELVHNFFQQTSGYGISEEQNINQLAEEQQLFAEDNNAISFPETAEEEQERINKWLREKYGNATIGDI
jgi:hypothetical protein